MKLPYSPLKTGSSFLTLCFLCSQLHAAPLTWNGGVSGDWVNGGTGWIGGTWSNATPDSAIFSGTSPTSLTINSGGITVDDISVTSGTYSIDGPGTLTLSNTAIDIGSGLTTTISAALAGSTGLTKTGAGTLVFTGTNKNYTGTTAINGGAIQISSAAAGALGSTNNGTVSLNGGALHALFSTNTNVNYAISVGASGGELRNLGGDSGRWQMVSNTISGSGILTLSFGSNNTRFNMGTTTQNSFNGKWVIDSGGNVNRFVDVDGNSTFGNVSGDDAITLQNSGTILFRSTRTYGSGYGITLGSGGGNIVAGGTQTVTLAAKLSGAAANNLRFDLGNASSVIILTNTANSWEGATTLAGAGILRIGAAGVIPDGGGTIEVASGTRLDLNGFSETIGGLSGAGTVDNMLGSSTSIISVGGNNASTTFSGILQNSGASSSLALTKVGTGTLTLSNAANTFGGGTTVSAGILQVNNAGALGSGNVTLNASNSASPSGNRAQLWLNGVTVTGKTLTLNPTTNRAQLIATGVTGGTWDGTVTLTGTVGANGSPEFTNNTGNGPLTVAGTVNGSLASGALVLRGTSASNLLSASVNIGSTPIEKTDSGTWTISSSGNTWGATAINSGTLLLGASSALPDASNLTMASSTTLGLAGTHSLGGSRTGTLLLSGNATIDFGSIGNTQALVFGDSSLLNWGSFALTINNWESGVDTLRFGTTPSGLTSSQLAGINFTGFSDGAQIDSMGFVTPIPEPSSLFLLSAGLAILALRRRKS